MIKKIKKSKKIRQVIFKVFYQDDPDRPEYVANNFEYKPKKDELRAIAIRMEKAFNDKVKHETIRVLLFKIRPKNKNKR